MRLARVVGAGLCVFVLTTTGGTGASAERALPLLSPPTFRPALNEWLTVTTGPTRHLYSMRPLRAIGIAPQVWAISTRRSDLSALQPYALGTGLRRLSRNAVLIVATTVGRGGPTRSYRRARWPLRLRAFRFQRTWETQPAPNVQEGVVGVSIRGWRLDVRVYFATQRPSQHLLGLAQSELNRMRLPVA
jgi:hypothetical protein